MTRTTPPRPVDVAAVFPALAPLARTATRLHPRPGNPSPQDSSVGGPLLWPASKPWPHCDDLHAEWYKVMTLADARLERRILAATHGRAMTAEQRETFNRINEGIPIPDDPIVMLPTTSCTPTRRDRAGSQSAMSGT
ncbi:hypothetical protein ACQP0C_02155 [Nocardia sp. CA-129566]|uniref:hypothetical protein n=1 Tax=Nocardia sp. CA-129566 TaxID=3239976 RepID=UPI003D9644F0